MKNLFTKLQWICLGVSVLTTLAILAMTWIFSQNDHFILLLYAPACLVLGLCWAGFFWETDRKRAIKQLVLSAVFAIVMLVAGFAV